MKTYKLNEMSEGEQMVVNAIIKSYIAVYGQQKWDSLTTEEQHTVIMTIAKTFTMAMAD